MAPYSSSDSSSISALPLGSLGMCIFLKAPAAFLIISPMPLKASPSSSKASAFSGLIRPRSPTIPPPASSS